MSRIVLGLVMVLCCTLASSAPAQDVKGLDLPVEPGKVAAQKKVEAWKRKLPEGDPRLRDVPPDPPPPTDGEEKPPTFFGQEVKSSNQTLYYVIDISGSMSYRPPGQFLDADGVPQSGTRLDRAKVELVRSISSLPETFEFNVMAYDCGFGIAFQKMTAATMSSKAAAVGWVHALQPHGGTGTGAATALALGEERHKTRAVVLLSDGAPNCLNTFGGGWGGGILDSAPADDHRKVIRAANSQGAVVNTFGIDCQGEFRKFMEAVACDGGGSYQDVR